jgi:hypothetical protein
VSGHPHVDVPILAVTLAVTAAVLTTLLVVSRRGDPPPAVAPPASWSGSLSRPEVAARTAAVVLLLLTIAAGRFGTDVELENIAPALVVGSGWPLLTVASLALPVWRWTDPWDAMARGVVPGDDSEPAGHVWPAVVLAAVWMWFLAVYPRPLAPRAVSLVLLAHTTLTLAGCLVAGRRRWLSSGEPVGVMLAWTTAAARGRLDAQRLPRGAAALVGTVVGGLLFAVLGRTGLWTDVARLPDATLYGTAGLAACCALGAGLLGLGAALGARMGDRAVVLSAALPLTAGLVAAVALERNRLFTSVQLLPGLFGDPFGAGWDLLGPAAQGLDPQPLGAAGLIAAQIGVLAVGLVWGAFVAARGSARRARVSSAVVLGYLSAVSVVALALH